jgi:hypothetical protein
MTKAIDFIPNKRYRYPTLLDPKQGGEGTIWVEIVNNERIYSYKYKDDPIISPLITPHPSTEFIEEAIPHE